jgi:putative salt-induced outer membrane protein
MNTKHIILSTALVGLTTALPAMAEETTQTWDASAELGFVLTSGNSETETLNAKFDASTSYTDWKHMLHLETLNSSSNDIRSAEKYLVEVQSDRAINERSYGLGVITWEKDKFNGFDYQASVAIGYGYKVIDDDNMKLNVEAGPGYRVSEFESGNNEEDGILRVAETFSWNLSDTATLDQFLNTEAGDSNTVTRFGVAVTSQIANELSMKVGYTLKNNSDVPAGSRKNDHETSVTLVYKF